MKIGIIGYGRIGQEVAKRINKKSHQVRTVATSSGVYSFPEGESELDLSKGKFYELNSWLEAFSKVDIAVLSIPTEDYGDRAYEYMKALLERGIPVVTSEKGSLSKYFTSLKKYLPQIGYSAVVGGGTGLLHWVKSRLYDDTLEVHLVINGTLNYICDSLGKCEFNEIAHDVIALGYAEPGTGKLADIMAKECYFDIPMKVSVLFNICGFGEISAADIDTENSPISPKELFSKRYIVSISKEKIAEKTIHGFQFECNGWHVSAGFKETTGFYETLKFPGITNGCMLRERGGNYFFYGPGTGLIPASAAIIRDIDHFQDLRNSK